MGRALSLTLWSGAVHAQAYGSESFEGLVREVAETRQRKGNMEELQARLDNPRAKGSLAVTVEWQRRLRTVLEYIAAAKPHIITLQEVDHMASLQFELAKLGYACGEEGKPYTPAHAWAGTRPEKRDDFTQFNRDHGRFLRHLEAVGVAFVPKTQSNCRAFGLRDGHADADDDGVAIFWRTDAFELTELSFLCVNDEKRMQGVVRTRLRRKADGASLAVICTHLSSGTKSADEIVRMKELTEPTLGTEGKPTEPSLVRWFEESAKSSATLLCLDANTRPDQREEAADEATVWKTLRSDPRRGQLMRSVWDKWFDADGDPKTGGGMPVTTNKMRGPLSSRECSHLDPARPALLRLCLRPPLPCTGAMRRDQEDRRAHLRRGGPHLLFAHPRNGGGSRRRARVGSEDVRIARGGAGGFAALAGHAERPLAGPGGPQAALRRGSRSSAAGGLRRVRGGD